LSEGYIRPYFEGDLLVVEIGGTLDFDDIALDMPAGAEWPKRLRVIEDGQDVSERYEVVRDDEGLPLVRKVFHA
jgi:hypothetical protein